MMRPVDINPSRLWSKQWRFYAEKGETTEYFAIDLGCGAGRDTFALLAEGWRVLAIDQQSGSD
jgi:hypothetical protein